MKIASAPISWGICDVPGYGYQYPYEEVLADMRELGIEASEVGSKGFLPDAPEEAGAAMRAAGIEPIGTYLDLVFHTEDDGWREQLRSTIDYVRAAGGDTIVLAALPAPHTYADHEGLTEGEWQRLLGNFDEAVDIAEAAGVVLAVHPHLGTLVLRPGEIARVLSGSRIKLCVDTGHAFAGGNDVARLIRDAGERLAHLHLKDADRELVERMDRGEIEFLDAVSEGIFRPLGEGDLPIDDIMTALIDIDYPGWVVLEQDIRVAERPEVSPKEDVARSLRVVQAALARA